MSLSPHRNGDDSSAETQAKDSADVERQQPQSRRKKSFAFYMSFLSLMLLSLAISWDATSLSVGLPVIASRLHGNTFQSFWASIAFLLGVVVTQPIYSSVSDVLGRKLPLYFSILLFTAGSILFGVSNHMAVLVVSRLLQGIGAGGLDVLQAIILSDITSLSERPFWLALESIPIAAGTIAGPLLGAAFVEKASWRWIGLFNVPLVVAALVLAVVFLRLRSLQLGLRARLRRLDWAGMALFAAGATCISLALTWADTLYSWASWQTLVPLLGGAGLLVVFVVLEARPSLPEPMLPLRILGGPNAVTARATLLCSFLHGLIVYTVITYIPLFFEAVFLQSPLEAGLSFLPTTASTVVFTAITPIIIELTRRYRAILLLGWLLATVALGLWCTVGRMSSLARRIGFQIMLGVAGGGGFALPLPMQASVVHVDDAGLASGMVISVRLTGGLVGMAIASALFNSVFRDRVDALGRLLPDPLGNSLTDAGGAIKFIPTLRTTDLPEQVMAGLLDAYRDAFRAIWIAMACTSALCMLCSFFVKDLSLEQENIGRQAFVDDTRRPTGLVSTTVLRLDEINIDSELSISGLYSKETWGAMIRQAGL